MSRNTKRLLLLAAAATATVLAAHGGFNGGALWNLLPLPVALLPLLADIPVREIRWAISGFSYTITSTVLLAHVGYLAGAGAFLTSSPGGKLMGLPLYALAAGYLVGMVCVAAGVARAAGEGRREAD